MPYLFNRMHGFFYTDPQARIFIELVPKHHLRPNSSVGAKI